jgi:hypothetical protein
MSVSNIIGGDQGNRSKMDFYPTPDIVTHSLMQTLNLPYKTRVWEPACGQMNMALVLSQYVDEVQCTDIQMGQDFLTYEKPEAYDWIITNPPFSLAAQFIRKAYDYNVPFAFLLKGHYWHAKERFDLFHDCQPHVVMPLTWRPTFVPGKKNPMMEMCWCIWYLGKPDETIYVPMLKGKPHGPQQENARN